MKPDTSLFWAKTSDNHLTKPNAFHPLICHLIDVAVVTKQIWQDVLPRATKERIVRAFGETDVGKENLEKFGSLVAFVAGLHDLGKCSPPFALRGKGDQESAAQLEKFAADQKDKSSEYAKKLYRKIQTIKFLKLYENTDFHIKGGVAKAGDAPHGFVTAVELPQILTDKFGFDVNLSKQISIMIGGHHGVFPSSGRINDLNLESCLGNKHWKNARGEIAEMLARTLNVEPLQQNSNPKLDNGTIMILAGLVSVADWIGSDANFFRCAVDDYTKDFNLDLKEYFGQSKTKAKEALENLGWLHWSEIEKPKAFFDLFPDLKKYPLRELQSEAIEIAEELKTQGIVVIESPMGEGKTEAAMFLADTWNANLNQRGIYFALPTQATSNQMFTRVVEFLEDRFKNGKVQTQLLHGKAIFSEDAAKLKKRFREELEKKLDYGHQATEAELKTLESGNKREIQDIFDENCSDCIPAVVAAEWFTARKRGLLAPFGVGTIDQALMAVLQTKHVFVRLFGLAHKTIIIDEVHAYDAYMSTLLERLLEWLAALGSPVILLSATLPIERRNALIKAYQKGLGVGTNEIEMADYPRISYATDSMIKVRHIKSSTKTKTLHIEKVDEILIKQSDNSYRINETFVENLKAKLEKDGGCAAIICNTVGRSQEIYDQLSKNEFFKGNDKTDGSPKLDLLHSRFRFCDRDEIEKRVRIRFGKKGEKVKVMENGKEVEKSVKRPDFAVLVSTQIIEQSLDIDFDLIISDLAPADLLLQRAGRLHRHERLRPTEFKDATFWIIQPEIKENLPDFGVHKFVYDEHILLRSWLVLNEIEKIEIPTEIENLVENVYDFEKFVENLSDELKDLWQKSLEKCLKSINDDNAQAENRYIKRPCYSRHISGIFTNNLDEDSPEIHKSLQAVTRLTEPTAAVICLWEKADKIFLDEDFTREINLDVKPYPDQTKELLRYSLSISNKSVVFKFFAEEVPKGWRESALLRNHRVILFDEKRKCEKFGYIFCLDKNIGLKIINDSESKSPHK